MSNHGKGWMGVLVCKEYVNKILVTVTLDKNTIHSVKVWYAHLLLLLGTAGGGVSVHVLFCFLFIATLLLIGLLCLKKAPVESVTLLPGFTDKA